MVGWLDEEATGKHGKKLVGKEFTNRPQSYKIHHVTTYQSQRRKK